MKSYVSFIEAKTFKKTKTFEVISKTDNSKLAEIKWHPAYRSYALFVTSDIYYDNSVYPLIPNPDAKIFDIKCLTEITKFIEALMEERKTNNDSRSTI